MTRLAYFVRGGDSPDSHAACDGRRAQTDLMFEYTRSVYDLSEIAKNPAHPVFGWRMEEEAKKQLTINPEQLMQGAHRTGSLQEPRFYTKKEKFLLVEISPSILNKEDKRARFLFNC